MSDFLERNGRGLAWRAKHRYPLTPIEDYAAWTRADGSAFDPWLRTHLQLGAQLLTTSPASQTFTGTVRQWQEWTGLDLPGQGAYVVPDALGSLHGDRRHLHRTDNLGTAPLN